MSHLHGMLIEDEIIMCGIVMLSGIVVGVISRVIYSVRQRRATQRPHAPV